MQFLGVSYGISTNAQEALEFLAELPDKRKGRARWPITMTRIEYDSQMSPLEVQDLKRKFDEANKLIGRREWQQIALRYRLNQKGLILARGSDVCLVRYLQQVEFELNCAQSIQSTDKKDSTSVRWV